MKLSWADAGLNGRYYFEAQPGEYDGVPPIGQLLVDRDALFLKNDVINLASFLVFAPFVSGELILPRKVSAELAEAMQDYLAPAWCGIFPLDLNPTEAPQGDGMALLNIPGHETTKLPNQWGMPRNVSLTVLDSAEWSGSILATDEIRVASNAPVFSKFVPQQEALSPYISVALLFMEAFRCNTLVIPDSIEIDDVQWDRLSRLMDTVKFGFLRESEARVLLEESANSVS
ncbi:hypothetical protein [Gulosibacter sediminis]|uniref:hypothetical protein n=1 Tax=Gulosibacter sediminis TaxID=1729695 RepID=UPI0024ACE135|nr:hypothetical protein [Gulosibacter sediminis]